MEDFILSSKKIRYEKFFKKAKISVICLIVLTIAISLFQYVRYLQGQSYAVDYMKATSEEYDDYSGSYKDLVDSMYWNLNPAYSSGGSVYIDGYGTIDYGDNSGVIDAAEEADFALGQLLEDKGFDCYHGSKYLQFTGFVGYFEFYFWQVTELDDNGLLLVSSIISLGLALILIVLTILYKLALNKEIYISDESIICKKKNKNVKEFMINDIKTVELTSIKGLKIIGNSINYNIKLVENRAEIKDFIMQKLTNLSNQTSTNVIAPQSNANELKQFKDLLDSGVITQEEFDAKKKQLLGL